MDLLLICGVSGSGKSSALGALEDSGYYAVNHLPVQLLSDLAQYLQLAGQQKVAVALDLTDLTSVHALPDLLSKLRVQGWTVRLLYLDCKTETLVKRFSETRRRHPLSDPRHTLSEAIDAERAMLAQLSELGYRLDTSELSAHALRSWVRDFISVDAYRITLLFESFGFKHGVPLDADLVFDVRCLPNPHYEPELSALTGRDPAVKAYLACFPEVERMLQDIYSFIATWLPDYMIENRNYLTVAIGCTGGQHRSVYLVEKLAEAFNQRYQVLVRHRECA